MNITVYGFEPVNASIFHNKNKNGQFTLQFVEDILTLDTVDACRGSEGILINSMCILTDAIGARLQQNGVKYLASRAAGTDHLDRAVLKRYGLQAAHVPSYSPNAISELTVLMMLNLLRKMPRVQKGCADLDFRTDTWCGRELRSMHVGVLGTGNIGMETLRILRGFDCDVAVLQGTPTVDQGVLPRPQKAAVLELARYASLEEIQANSDILLFHMPLTTANYHIINQAFLEKCKDGVVLINTARGAIFDFADVLTALQSGKVGGLGFDVYENEERFVCSKSNPEAFHDGVIEQLCA